MAELCYSFYVSKEENKIVILARVTAHRYFKTNFQQQQNHSNNFHQVHPGHQQQQQNVIHHHSNPNQHNQGQQQPIRHSHSGLQSLAAVNM